MEDFFDAELTPEQKAEIVRQLDKYLAAAQRLCEQMAKGWEEIDRLNAEAQTELAQLREKYEAQLQEERAAYERERRKRSAWPDEKELLRQENQHLRERLAQLEQRSSPSA